MTFDEVNYVCYTDHGQGTLDGALIGAVCWIVIFLIAGSAAKQGAFTPNPDAFAAGGALLGTLPGLLIGAVMGHKNYYQFSTVLY